MPGNGPCFRSPSPALGAFGSPMTGDPRLETGKMAQNQAVPRSVWEIRGVIPLLDSVRASDFLWGVPKRPV